MNRRMMEIAAAAVVLSGGAAAPARSPGGRAIYSGDTTITHITETVAPKR